MARDLHVTSPSMSGPDVVKVQESLAALGYAPGTCDGVYGPATAAAVKAFQKARKLTADGWVGADTRTALNAKPTAVKGDAKEAAKSGAAAGTRRLASAGGTPPAAPATAGSAPGVLALAEAVKHIGVKEQPAGSNRTAFGKWFGVDAVPWCNIFVSYCFQLGAGVTIAKGFKGAGAYPGKGCTYVPSTEAWLQAAGLWLGRTEPQPGDIAIFNWDGGRPDHIGIVEQSLGDGRFNCIEGNTSAGNDSNGGEVQRRLRTVSQVDGFGRVSG